MTRRSGSSEIQRDRYGRPLVIPIDGGEPIPYMRASRFAGLLDDEHGLMAWKQRMTAIGIAERPDLGLAVVAHQDDKRRLDQLCEEAMQSVGAGRAATTGTALHRLTEKMDRGERLGRVPTAYRADLAAYKEATEGFRMLMAETFVVVDELRVAGSFDRLFMDESEEAFIADLKTGSVNYGLLKFEIQLAVYAHGKLYNPETGERRPLSASQERGLVIHLPAGQGHCERIWLDLKEGWEAAQVADEVRRLRREGGRRLVI